MSPTCRQYVGGVSAATSLADIIFDHVGNMSGPTCRQQLATCRRFLTFLLTSQTATFPAKHFNMHVFSTYKAVW
jgi:hypothetical protein